VRIFSGDRPADPLALSGLLAGLMLAGLLAAAGCGGEAPAAPAAGGDDAPAGSGLAGSRPAGSGPAAEPAQARAQLAARAAAAQDRHMVATYRLSRRGEPDRAVRVTLATDRSWRVDVEGGALGGAADVSVTLIRDGLYQCGLGDPAGCVRVGDRAARLDPAHDPRVEHVFADWLSVLTDQRAALAVSPARPAEGVRGSCYAVESSSASLAAPLDLGVYCFDETGTLTGATLGFGTLALDGEPGPAPATVSLPGPVVSGDPLPTAAPSPSAPASPSATG
jgi:hypothetical protein